MAAENCHIKVVSLLAPLMEGSEALRKSREALNQAMLNVEQVSKKETGSAFRL